MGARFRRKVSARQARARTDRALRGAAQVFKEFQQRLDQLQGILDVVIEVVGPEKVEAILDARAEKLEAEKTVRAAGMDPDPAPVASEVLELKADSLMERAT